MHIAKEDFYYHCDYDCGYCVQKLSFPTIDLGDLR